MGLLREAMEGGLDLGGGAGLSHPEHLVGALPGELVVMGGGARRPAAPRERKGQFTAEEEESPELHRAKRHYVAAAAASVEWAGVT